MTNELNKRLADLVHRSVHESLTAEEHAELEEMLLASPELRDEYFLLLDLEYGLAKLAVEETGRQTLSLPEAVVRPAHMQRTEPTPASQSAGYWPLLALALFGLLVAPVVYWAANQQPVAHTDPQTGGNPDGGQSGPAIADMQIMQLARSRFFGEPRAFAPGDTLALNHDYALVEGSVQLRSRTGAEMIVQAPAVFAIQSAERVLLKVGECSVYAPDGAEGFRVLTPQAEVVDKGTRFSISVNESGEADVEVIEGAAEVFTAQEATTPVHAGLLLEAGEGRVINSMGEVAAGDGSQFGRTYKSILPDRIISFDVSPDGEPEPDKLLGVTAQRGGKTFSYDVDQLIGFDLIHFKVNQNINNLTTPLLSVDPKSGDDTRRRAEYLDRDHCLCTGILNPGGSEIPLDSDPDITNEDLGQRTPGLAVRFHEPIVNGPGPDIVLFDLHVVVHPEDGDPFHVSPTHFEPGLKSHTIRQYDISLVDHGSHQLSSFRLYGFDRRIRSVDELCQSNHNGGVPHAVPAKVIAAGIDLSDLGYPEGAEVRELFIQDAMDDDNYIDPVFIGGFPPVSTTSPEEPNSTEE
ncbi:FecR domain-containing protein [Bremerella sp. P1]|uniref:FecR domain-containing protein n=1 Tax=Bremerella sp. P1 TaxID=3026424 RepID=UPI0023677080|nr:FecR domain-containing protein [Bremerella sp. P1]WDI43899.1 iron dicitrate transport regulator FecR [Bremerella sp. P1]